MQTYNQSIHQISLGRLIRSNPLYVFLLFFLFLLHGLIKLFGKNLPENLMYGFLFFLLKYRRDVAVQNLSKAFPEKNYAEIQKTLREFYKYLSVIFIETIRLAVISKKQYKKQVNIRNPELLTKYKERSQPVILMMGHYGNWECMSIIPNLLSMEMYAVYKTQQNGFFNRFLLYLRSRFGMKMLSSEKASKFILRRKNVSSAYIFIADQAPPPSSKLHTVFLHQPTYVFAGAEKIANRLDCPVLYVSLCKNTINQGWDIQLIPIQDKEENIIAQGGISRTFFRFLEADILQKPPYWLWTHKRWKRKVVIEGL